MPHVTVPDAIAMAEADARGHWNGAAPPPHNCGAAQTDYIFTDEADTLIDRWRARGQTAIHGAQWDRRASYSSGEPKVDLKFVTAGAAAYVAAGFNYHIKFQRRPVVVVKLTEEQEKSRRRSECENEVNKLRRAEGKAAYPGTAGWLKIKWID